MKTCTKCGKAKPVTEFYSNGREGPGKVGLHASCKTCMTKAATATNYRRAAERRKGKVYVAQAEAAAKLVVSSDGPGVLVVDTLALMPNNLGPRFWRLVEVDGSPGMWLHPQSGTDPGPLSELLRGIADCYIDREATP